MRKFWIGVAVGCWVGWMGYNRYWRRKQVKAQEEVYDFFAGAKLWDSPLEDEAWREL